MNFVEPIRESKLVRDMASYLKKTNERNYIMFLCGIYTGLRISDILKLKVSDVKNKNYISLREQKTGKQKTFEINPVLKREITSYIVDKDPDDYLIKSREDYNKPLTRSMAYKIMQEVADKFSLECIGCHTLRKTFGYHFYQQTKDVVTLMKIFNHSHPNVTLRYIGIEQESINKAIKKFRIF
jgi:integrase